MIKIIEKIKGLITGKNKVGIIVFAGICGIVLIALSQINVYGKKETVTASQTYNDADYCTEIEKKISSLVCGITGDKDCIVAVTLETGNEYVYANQTTTDTDRSQDNGSDKTTTKESEKNAQEYIIIKSENGTEQPLTVTEKKPCIRGVAVVSSGINDATKSKIESSVVAMLDLSSRRISITGKAGTE